MVSHMMKGMIGILMSVSCCRAALEWKATELSQCPNPLQAKATYRFSFINKGTDAVKIESVRPSCGCLSAGLNKQEIASGEQGILTITFDLRGRTGAQRKTVEVKTNRYKPDRLVVKAQIPPAFTFSDKRLIWSGAASTKSITVTNASPQPLFIERVVSSDERIKVECIPKRDGFEYELRVTPEEGLESFHSVLRVYPAKPEGVEQVRTFKLYAVKS